MSAPSLEDRWAGLLRELFPAAHLERQRRVELAITGDGRPRVDRAFGVLATAAMPVYEADQVAAPDGSGYDSVADVIAAAVGNRTVSADNGDADRTLVPGTDDGIQRWNTPLTAARTVSLATAGVANGAAFRVVRTAAATGLVGLAVGSGPLTTLAPAQWCDVAFDGAAWVLTARGSAVPSLQASTAVDWPNLTPNSSATATVAIPGAVLGDVVLGASMDVDLAGCALTAYVSAAGVATAVLRAGSGGSVDLPPGTLRVVVGKGI